MKIKKTEITVGEIANGYRDDSENGVTGYGGKLNIRPPYQREFVYGQKQMEAVMRTITKGFPLNVMYWSKNDDGTFEVLDGQQRTISFCRYVNGDYSVDDMYFHTLTEDEQERILNYKVDIYICEGSDRERLDWFETINIAGEKLTRQELLNINYTGRWLTDAKQKFSKNNCIAHRIASKYVKGSPIRQEFLETALAWISKDNVAQYMAKHCKDANANELWLYFNSVIEWVNTTFGESNYRKEMLGLEWGRLYDTYHGNIYDVKMIEQRVNELMSNEEVTDKKGVYEYILGGESEEVACKLSKRIFSQVDKRTAYERQGGICPITGERLDISEMEADHIVPWWKGGTTTLDNLQMISKSANKRKSGRTE